MDDTDNAEKMAAEGLQGKKIILTTGGTGGHVFPALATAHALRASGASVTFITNQLPNALSSSLKDFPVHVISAASPSGNLAGMFVRLAKIISGMVSSFLIVRRIRPDLVIGYGGYTTTGPLTAATLLKIPMMLHEQNAVAGKANLHFVDDAKALALSFPRTNFGKLQPKADAIATVTGNPVRPVFFNVERRSFNDNDKVEIFITGGSQAAATFAYAIPTALEQLSQERRDRIRVVQQCRQEQCAALLQHYQRMGVEADIEPFFEDMPKRLAQCSFVISRAGASTLSEIAASGTPAVLVPYFYAAGNHQQINAEYFVDRHAALMIMEDKKRGLLPEHVLKAVEIMMDSEKRDALSQEVSTLGVPDAAEQMVTMAVKIINVEEKTKASAKKNKSPRKKSPWKKWKDVLRG